MHTMPTNDHMMLSDCHSRQMSKQTTNKCARTPALHAKQMSTQLDATSSARKSGCKDLKQAFNASCTGNMLEVASVWRTSILIKVCRVK